MQLGTVGDQEREIVRFLCSFPLQFSRGEVIQMIPELFTAMMAKVHPRRDSSK